MNTYANDNVERDYLDFYFHEIDDIVYLTFNRLGGILPLLLEEELKEYLASESVGCEEESAWYIRWNKFLPEGFNWHSSDEWDNLDHAVKIGFIHDIHREAILARYG